MFIKKNKIVVVITIFLGFFVIFLLGYYIGKTPVLVDTLTKEQIQKNFLKDLRQVGILAPLPLELKNIAGNLIKIENDFILIKPKEDKSINPLGAFFPKEIKFLINSDTKFFLAHKKDEDEFMREYDEYRDKIEAQDNSKENIDILPIPQRFSYESIDFRELKVGDSVNIICNRSLLNNQDNLYAEKIDIMNEIEQSMNMDMDIK
jgi:hypothetical protein